MDSAKLKAAFSDKAYVESLLKMNAEDAAKSLTEKGVEVTVDDLMKVRDFIVAHKEELQNGELSEETLASVTGGMSETVSSILVGTGIGVGMFLLFASTVFIAW